MGSRMGDGDSSVGATQTKVCCGLCGCLRRNGTGAEEKKYGFIFFCYSGIYFFVRVLAGKVGSGQQVACGFVLQVGFLVGFAWAEAHSWCVGWSVGDLLAVCCL